MKKPARFNGTCDSCSSRVEAGTEVDLQNTGGKWRIASCPSCNSELGKEVAPPIELRVQLQKVSFSSEKFTSIKVTLDGPAPEDFPIGEGRQFTVCGRAFPQELQVGDVLDVRGNFSNDPKWGWQLQADRCLPAIAATDQSLVAFLKRFPQVGGRRAEEILRHFGGREATLAILDTAPGRLAEINGITPERALEIGEKFAAEHMRRDALIFLSDLGLSEAIQTRAMEAFGEDARATLLEDPYQLMELHGVGLKTADDVAKRLGVQVTDPRRIAAATYHLLQQLEQEGYTWADMEDLLRV